MPPPSVVPPLLVGQGSEGTQANRTSYAVPGASVSCVRDSDGSGSPVAASPVTWVATVIFEESAAPCGAAPTLPEPVTVQLVPETLDTRNEP